MKILLTILAIILVVLSLIVASVIIYISLHKKEYDNLSNEKEISGDDG